jgi:hypothetical protein
MFAREQKQEYDPASVPAIERPLAKLARGNSFMGSTNESATGEHGRPWGHKRQDSKNSIPSYSPTSSMVKSPPTATSPDYTRRPSKDQISPTKSSLAHGRFNPKASYDPETGTWSEDSSSVERELPPGKSLHRHAKSVTFDAAPPQVNEYEMATPDLSSVGTGSRENSYDSNDDEEEEEDFNQGDEEDEDDSFDASLEDTDKTPVVGPDDWRHASPSEEHGIDFEDPFQEHEGSPIAEAGVSSPAVSRSDALRNDSVGSDHRPLPPLPGMESHKRTGSNSSIGLAATAERLSSSQRSLPAPPAPAAFTKSDLQGLSGGKMTLEERLRLMMIQDDEKPKSPEQLQRERRMRRGGPRERNSQTPEADSEIKIHEDEDTLGELSGLGDYQLPPRISRESIMRKVNGEEPAAPDSDYDFSSPMQSSSPERHGTLDPDVPIPSTEDASVLEHDDTAILDDDDEGSVIIKPEQEEDEIDLYAITEMYQQPESAEQSFEDAEENMHGDDGSESHYSDTEIPVNESPKLPSNSTTEDEGPPTPRPQSLLPAEADVDPVKEDGRVSLPEFSGILGTADFGLGLQSYMTPSPPPPPEKDVEIEEEPAAVAAAREYMQRPSTPEKQPQPRPDYDGSGWGPEEDEQDFEAGTPESVIRHPVSRSPSPPPTPPEKEDPSVPERVATIKASGSKLKTRPSATPADLASMRETRRQVSGELPPIPQRHRSGPSFSDDGENGVETVEEEEGEVSQPATQTRKSSLYKRSLTLDIGQDLSFDLDQDFDRVIEAQKVAFDQFISNLSSFTMRPQGDITSTHQHELSANVTPRKQRGYLMRQNTKVVIASSDVGKARDDDDSIFRGTRSAGNSPIKRERPESWTVEPWNGQMRRRSIRDLSASRKKPGSGPAPPMPGHMSAVAGLSSLSEEAGEPLEDTGERGRVFVKVIGVKDLDLPLPRSEYSSILNIRDANSFSRRTLLV